MKVKKKKKLLCKSLDRLTNQTIFGRFEIISISARNCSKGYSFRQGVQITVGDKYTINIKIVILISETRISLDVIQQEHNNNQYKAARSTYRKKHVFERVNY